MNVASGLEKVENPWFRDGPSGRSVWDSSLDRLDTRLWVRIPLKAWMFDLVYRNHSLVTIIDAIWSSY